MATKKMIKESVHSKTASGDLRQALERMNWNTEEIDYIVGRILYNRRVKSEKFHDPDEGIDRESMIVPLDDNEDDGR